MLNVKYGLLTYPPEAIAVGGGRPMNDGCATCGTTLL